MVKIKATGFGVTALRSGLILHFDVNEAKLPKDKRDMRKLEAEVDIEDARRIKELGWGDFADAKQNVDGDGERAELGDEVSKLEEAPAPERGKAAQEAPRADRDDPDANAFRLANPGKQPRPKRPSEVKKAAAKKAASKPAKKAAATPAASDPAKQEGEEQKTADQTEVDPDKANGGADVIDNDDPEAGPTTQD